MDWLERLTGLSPDFGDGSIELTLIVGVALIVAVLLAVVRSKPQRTRSQHR